MTACQSRPIPQDVCFFSPIQPMAADQDVPQWDPEWGWYFGGRYERAPDEARTSESFGIRLENLSGDPVANVFMSLDGDRPTWVDTKPVFRATAGLIDAEHQGFHYLERVHVFERLDSRGSPDRVRADGEWFRVSLPGGGVDDEIWVSIPLGKQPGLGHWEYASDAGSIVMGRAVAWRMRLGIACRSM